MEINGWIHPALQHGIVVLVLVFVVVTTFCRSLRFHLHNLITIHYLIKPSPRGVRSVAFRCVLSLPLFGFHISIRVTCEKVCVCV
uniref:Putative secreted protein n=1 Tax=Anopheles darlingi TaxID=43151 RepID=A0A2M4D5H1_ANODA